MGRTVRNRGATQSFGPDKLPPYLIKQLAQKEATLDYDALSARFHRYTTEIEPIKSPSREMWEGLLVQASLRLPFDYPYFWALHFYKGSGGFRQRVDELNKAVESSGLTQLRHGEEPETISPAAVIRRGIEGARISSAFLDSWIHLARLYGQLIELRATNEEMAHTFEAGATAPVVGQRVWYARWLIAHANPLEEKRQNVESELADLCRDIVRGRRKLPDKWVWKADWFKRLLPAQGKAPNGPRFSVAQRGADAGMLASCFTRLSNDTVRKLAAHRYVTADFLPPLAMGEFPPGPHNHP